METSLEQDSRIAYVHRTIESVREATSRDDICNALGDNALRLYTLVSSYKLAGLSEIGSVSVPPGSARTDDLLILPLRRHETAMRDNSFAAFTPTQYKRAANPVLLRSVTDQMRQRPPVRQGGLSASAGNTTVVNFVERASSYPSPTQDTYFNMRPLLLLRYVSERTKPDAGAFLGACLHYLRVLDNPYVTVPHGADVRTVSNQWRIEAEELSQTVRTLSGRTRSR